MKKILFLLLMLPFTLFAQDNFHLVFFGGLANYQGDLRNKQFSFDQTQGAFGLGVKYDLGIHFALRGGINFAKIEGDDKKNVPPLQYRNLNFQTWITEGNLLVEYSLLDLNKNRFSPYVLTGIAVYHFNPYSYDTLGHKVYLQPLGTEGEGLPQYPDRKVYKLTQINIPLGAGIRFAVTDAIAVGYEFQFHKLFTDYLDDVSKTYADRQALEQGRGPLAVEMAYRGDELKNGNPNYPAAGSQRGNGGKNDWYYFHGITLTMKINARRNYETMHAKEQKRIRGSVSCPRHW